AFFVAPVDVAGAHPAVADGLGRLLRLVQVVRDRRAAARMEVAPARAFDNLAALVGEPGLVAVEYHARAARAIAVAQVMDERVQHLGGADGLDDLAAGERLPLVP